MCGLVGLLDATHGGFSRRDSSMLFGLMLINSLRGSSSTGLIGINKHKQADIYKVLGNPYNLHKTGLGDMFFDRMVNRYWGVIGHGRFPTQGEVTVKNAHPFEHKHITLVHNGTLKNLEELNKKHKKEFEVDSEMICWLISEQGLQKTIDEIEGAYALMFYDSEKDTYNVIRNAERPLFMGTNHAGDRMIFGSEKHYIKWADEYSYAYRDIKDVETHTHYEITRKSGKLEINKTNCSKTHKPFKQNYHGGYGGYGGYDEYEYDNGIYGRTQQTSAKSNVPVIYNQKTHKDIIMCPGEDVVFEVTEAVETRIGNNTPITMVTGVHEESLRIEVTGETGISAKVFDDIMKEGEQVFMIGTIEDIIMSQTAQNKIQTRIFVKEPTLYRAKNKIIELKPEPKEIKIKGNMKLSRTRYQELSRLGCVCCNEVILFSDSLTTSLVYDDVKGQRLLCEDCSNGKEEEKNVESKKRMH